MSCGAGITRAWRWPSADLPNRDWSVLKSFPQARYLEFGWGDAAYYQAPDQSFGVTIAAVFWPTPTVMEVVPWQAVAETTEDSETVVLHVSDAELQAIAQSIDDSFVQPISPTGKGYRVAGGRRSSITRAASSTHSGCATAGPPNGCSWRDVQFGRG